MILRATLLSIVVLAGGGLHAEDDPIRAVFVSPARHEFWQKVEASMRAACEDLGIDLQVRYAEGNRFNYVREGKKAIAESPDYIFCLYMKGASEELLAEAEAKQVYTILFNATVPSDQRSVTGAPREKFQYWIAEVVPNDRVAGELLGAALVDRARKMNLGEEGRFEMIGINGDHGTEVADLRKKGLEDALRKSGEGVTLRQVVGTDWSKEMAGKKASQLVRRYPKTRVVWTAADIIAFGVRESLEKDGLQPGRDVLLGGIDWTSEGIVGVEEGWMAATVGGHFSEGAWVAVLAHDHFHGRDFADLRVSFRTPFGVIHRDNVELYRKRLHPKQDFRSVDFRRFSRVIDRDLKDYDFRVEKIVETLTE